MNKSARHRNQNLDDHMILKIVEIIDGWPGGKLTWKSLIDRMVLTMRIRYTRQALHSHTRIKDAFTHRKTLLRNFNLTTVKDLSPEDVRIIKLEAEVARLKMENNNLLEQFHRWVYNGNINGSNINMREVMNAPLPKIYRDPSDIDRS